MTNVAEPTWWTKLPRDKQVAYKKSHPKSKLKIKNSKAKNIVKKSMSNAKASISKAITYVGKNATSVKKELRSFLASNKEEVKKDFNKLPNKDKSDIIKSIKTAVSSKKSEDTVKAISKLLLHTGLVAVGVASAAAIGLPVVVSLAALYEHKDNLFNKLDNLPTTKLVDGFIEYAFNGMRNGLEDHSRIKKAIVDEEPTAVTDNKEEASVNTLNDRTELLKKLYTLEKADVSINLNPLSNLINRRNLEHQVSQLEVLRNKFLGMEEIVYASRADKKVVSLLACRTTLQNSLLEKADVLPNIVKAIKKSCLNPNSVVYRTNLIDGCRIKSAFCIEQANYNTFVCVDNKDIYIGSSKTKHDIPIKLDKIDRNSSLRSIMQEYVLVNGN